MARSKIFLLFSILIFSFFSLGNAEDLDCEAEFQAAEQCFDMLMIGAQKIEWKKENVNDICQSKFQAIDCISSYRKKCVTGMASMVFSMISKKFNQTFNYICKNETAAEELLYHFNCLKKTMFSDDVKKCAEHSHLKLELIDEHGMDSKIPIICCSFVGLRQCMEGNLKSECDDSRGRSVDYVNALINKFSGDLSKMFCMDYKTADTCSKKMDPENYAELMEIDKLSLEEVQPRKKYKTFLRLIKHLVEQPIA